MLDGKAFGTEIVGIVRDFVARSVEPLQTKIESLQAKIAAIPRVDILDFRPMIAEEVMKAQLSEADLFMKEKLPDLVVQKIRDEWERLFDSEIVPKFEAIPIPKDGASVTPADLAPLVADYVAKAVAEIPKPKDGEPGATGKDGQDGASGRDGVDGKDGVSLSADDILPLIRDTVALIPKPKDGEPGKDADPEAIRALVVAEVAKAVAAIPPAKNGLDGKDGEKGIDGRDGRDGLPGVSGTPGEKGLDGINGKDGVDGFGLEDFEMSLADDGRTFTAKFVRGEANKAFTFVIPTVLDKGIYRAENEYTKGDGATWDGSWWIAQTETKDKPGTSNAWRLAAKRGRDGKDGAPGKEGMRGKDGAAAGLTKEQAMAIMNQR